MTHTKDEALKLALEALSSIDIYLSDTLSGRVDPEPSTYKQWLIDGIIEARNRSRADITVIEQALAAQQKHEPENEPFVSLAPVQDADGENKAVRSFLMLYGQPGLTVGKMKKHMAMSGFKSWPAWVETEPHGAHLTKAGAQLWIRHLFALEAAPHAAREWVGLMRGVRVEWEYVIVSVHGGNGAARKLCEALIQEMNK